MTNYAQLYFAHCMVGDQNVSIRQLPIQKYVCRYNLSQVIALFADYVRFNIGETEQVRTNDR